MVQSHKFSLPRGCSTMVRRAVLLGAGHAHLFTLKRTAAFVRRGLLSLGGKPLIDKKMGSASKDGNPGHRA